MSTESELINIISDVGFPIAITLYLLYRDTVTLNKIVSSMDKLVNKMDLMLVQERRNPIMFRTWGTCVIY